MTLFENEPTPFSEGRTFGVAELAEALRALLSAGFPDDVWVEGEIRNLTRARSGHVYLDLVDAETDPGQAPAAILSVMLFRSTRDIVNRQIKRAGGGLRMADGVRVRIRAVPDLYVPQGRLQLRMTGIDPSYTLGRLVADRERLLHTLAAQQLLGRNAAVPFPALPLRIALVTAATSAACADFLNELRGSAIAWDVTVIDTPVQGDQAPTRLRAAIRSARGLDTDVIAIVRGGGARTDLATFDHELVARAIAAAPVPVITGIGHEVDRSVADEVAAASFKTPTACAGHLVTAVETFERATDGAADRLRRGVERLVARHRLELTDLSHRIGHGARTRVAAAAGHLTAAGSRVEAVVPWQLVAADRRLAVASSRIGRAGPRHIAAARRRTDNVADQVRLLDPARVLARGWSITRRPDGAIVRSVTALAPGADLVTEVADGRLRSRVTTVEPAGDTPP